MPWLWRTLSLDAGQPSNAGLKAVAIPNRFSERQDLTVADLIVKSATELYLDRLAALVAGERGRETGWRIGIQGRRIGIQVEDPDFGV